jgi:ADP-ribosyl-[dinitrogen reductase] hydrolase
MHSTHLRRVHIHGGLAGIAIGEALALPRNGLSAKRGLKLFGRPGKYQYISGSGVYGEHTRLALLYAQSLLNSRNEMSNLRSAFRWRMSWYWVSLPPGVRRSTIGSGAKSVLRKLKIDTSTAAKDTGAMTRAVLSGSVMNGCGHRIVRWIEETTKLTHCNAMVLDVNRMIGVMADFGCSNPQEENVLTALEIVSQVCSEPALLDTLQKIEPLLKDGRSPKFAMKQLGWNAIGDDPLQAGVMAAYCWLRYPRDFRRATSAACRLGGQVAAVSAVAGGLVGTHAGYTNLPEDLAKSIACAPHDTKWIKELADRFSHWPHGSDDLYRAPAQVSDPLGQVARSLYYYPLAALHALRGRFLF